MQKNLSQCNLLIQQPICSCLRARKNGYIEKVYFWTKKDMSLHPLHTCILTLLLGVVKAP